MIKLACDALYEMVTLRLLTYLLSCLGLENRLPSLGLVLDGHLPGLGLGLENDWPWTRPYKCWPWTHRCHHHHQQQQQQQRSILATSCMLGWNSLMAWGRTSPVCSVRFTPRPNLSIVLRAPFSSDTQNNCDSNTSSRTGTFSPNRHKPTPRKATTKTTYKHLNLDHFLCRTIRHDTKEICAEKKTDRHAACLI